MRAHQARTVLKMWWSGPHTRVFFRFAPSQSNPLGSSVQLSVVCAVYMCVVRTSQQTVVCCLASKALTGWEASKSSYRDVNNLVLTTQTRSSQFTRSTAHSRTHSRAPRVSNDVVSTGNCQGFYYALLSNARHQPRCARRPLRKPWSRNLAVAKVHILF